MCLLKAGACLIQVNFNKLVFFWELKSCLLNTGCLLNRGGHYDRFNCIMFTQEILSKCIVIMLYAARLMLRHTEENSCIHNKFD